MRSALGQRLQRVLAKDGDNKVECDSAEDVEAWKANWVKEQYKGAIKRLKTITTSVGDSWIRSGT
eukprot:2587234-Pyramimonas_sp.AAC.1